MDLENIADLRDDSDQDEYEYEYENASSPSPTACAAPSSRRHPAGRQSAAKRVFVWLCGSRAYRRRSFLLGMALCIDALLLLQVSPIRRTT